MRLSNKQLYTSIRAGLAVGVLGAVGLPVSAVAQEETAERTLDRIQVTGSRIRQVDVETAQPILSITREEIEQQGFKSTVDILQNMTVTGSPPISRSAPLSSGEAVGGLYIDMRNLGAARTLILVNGKRLGTTTGGLQDVSQIPSSIIERIEVLKDGASSIYGSDAIAGVINIITRKNFTGAEANAYIGEYSEGDGMRQTYDFTIGAASDRGQIVMSVEYNKEEGIFAPARSFTADSYPGFPQYGWTTVGQYGRFSHAGNWWVADRGSDARTWNDFHIQDTTPITGDVSRSSDQMHIMNPIERKSLYVSGSYDIADSIRFTSDVAYTNRIAEQQVAGYPFQSGSAWGNGTIPNTHMSPDSWFNPVGNWGTGENTGLLSWTRRGWEQPRFTTYDADTWRFTGGFDGMFQLGERYFDWDVGYMYTRSTQLQNGIGNFQPSRVRAAVGPSFMNNQGIVQCGTPSAPIALTACVPWNPFAGYGAGSIANSLDDPAVRNFIFPIEHTTADTSTTSYYANIGGSLFALPAGDLAFALGYEYRREAGRYEPDWLRQTGDHSSLGSTTTEGGYNVDEFYMELEVPILADIPGFRELTLSAATRYSDFSTFGDTTNSKVGLRWRPIDDLLIRGTWAEGFRAPSVAALYGGGSQTFTTGFRDPCDSIYGDARGTARCLQDVAADYRQLQQGFIPTTGPTAQTPVPFFNGSNRFLQPETSESKTLGFVYSPSFLEGFNISVDWWNYVIDDTIITDHPNNILADCYVRGIESRCQLFTRDPVLGIVNTLSYGGRNSGYIDTEGYDIGLAYRFETDFGRFGANWNTTYTTKYNSKSTLDQAYESVSVSFGSTFRTRSNLNLSWDLGDFGVSWGLRYFSAMKEGCTFDEICTHPNYAAPDTLGIITPINRAGSNTFHDVQFRWNTPWDGTVAFGANNVTDHIGPRMFSQPSSNFAYYGGFDIGRFWYAKYQQRF